MRLKRKGDNKCHLLTADRTPGTGLRSFETPPHALFISRPRHAVGGVTTPHHGSQSPQQPRDAVPTSHCPRRIHAHAAAGPLPPSQKPWCLGFPADNKRQGLGRPSCSSLTSVMPSSLLPRLSLHIPSPPTPATNGIPRHQPQKALCCPAWPSQQCPPVCPGKRLHWGRGAVGTRGTEDSPGAGGRVGAGRARRGRLGYPTTTAHGSLPSRLRVPHGPHRCLLGCGRLGSLAGTPDTGTRVVSGAWGHRERSGELGRPPSVSTEPGGP